MVHRIDYLGVTIPQSRRTPQGGLALNANLTRTGVLAYRQPDGSVVRELRHPEEVFRDDSLNSLHGAPVVEGHPDMVRTDNWHELAKGHVGDNVRKQDRFVSATVRIMDKATVDKVEQGALVELSCGYTCDFDPTPGEWNGEKYDGIQRNIIYNHVGLGPRGWGRAGTEVALKFDSAYSVSMSETTTVAAPAAAQPVNVQVTLDTAELEKLRGERDALLSKVADLQKAISPEHIDTLVKARLSLLSDAKKLAPEANFDGLTDKNVMLTAIKAKMPSLRTDGLSDDYLKGVFSTLLASEPSVTQKQLSNIKLDAIASEPEKKDGMAEAYLKQVERNSKLWVGNNK